MMKAHVDVNEKAARRDDVSVEGAEVIRSYQSGWRLQEGFQSGVSGLL